MSEQYDDSSLINFNFEVHETQRLVLEDDHRFKTLVCGRRWGKDHLFAIKIIMECFSKISPRGPKLYGVLNPVYNPQGKESFRIFSQFVESGKLDEKIIHTPPMEVRLINGDRVTFFSADQPDHLRGGQYDGLIVNEASLIAGLTEMWNGPLSAMLIDREGWAWLTGTPKGKNAFYQKYLMGLDPLDITGQPNQWKSFRYSTYENPFIKRSELERLRKELPIDAFNQEFLAEFLDSGGMVFRGLSAMRERSQDIKLKAQGHSCRIGVDVGRHGDWTVLIALDPNNHVIGFDRFKDLPWPTIFLRIKTFLQRYRGKVVFDSSGAGDVLYEALLTDGIPITGVKFTNERKAAMVQNLASHIEDSSMHIPPPFQGAEPSKDISYLWNELEAFTYDILPTGKVRYSSPQGMHDDCVTALLLAASELPPMFAPQDQGTRSLDRMLDNLREPGETYGDDHADTDRAYDSLD